MVSVPEATYLVEELRQIETLDHNKAIQLAKSIREREWKAIEAWFMEGINEISGWDVSIRLSSVTDGIVRALARRMFRGNGVPESVWREIGLFAIGGYGRGELNPYSDLDVMIVYPDKQMPNWLQTVYNDFHTMLWDVGFKVGISLRGIPELDYLLKDDFVTATALLEYRLLLGTAAIDDAMTDLLNRFRKKRMKAFLVYKLDELMGRRNQAGASMFLMEPNLKTNPGCLRDVQYLYNIAFMIFNGRNLYALKELAAIKIDDIKSLFQANAHLLRLRSLLHFFHGRRQDELELRDQVRIAEQLGYSGYSRLSAVEVMMQEHYHMVLRVHKIVELLNSHLRLQGFLGHKLKLLRSRKVISKSFTAMAKLVYCTNKHIWKEADAAAQIMEAFEYAHEHNYRISLETQRHIRANIDVIQESYYKGRYERSSTAFMNILRNIGHLQTTLEDMHNCALLDAFMPEFGNISCLMQFNSYHQYTVDQHTLFAVGYLDKVYRGKDKGLPSMPKIFQSIKRKDLLVLGLLLHDVGKYMGRGHVKRGALMVGPVAARMGLNQDEEELVHFLVDAHVSLSDATRMRDIHDPELVAEFSDYMSTQERLDMLYCLTYADAKATSDQAMTGWQMSLMYELYCNISSYLKNDALVSRTGKRQRVHQALEQRGIPQVQIEAFLKRLPSEYVYNVTPDEATHHFELHGFAACNKLGFRKEYNDENACLEIAMPWRYDRFADVTGVLSAMGCQIIDARCWSLAREVLIYRFQVEHAIVNKFADESWWGKLIKHLQDIIEGTCDLEALLKQRVHNMVFEDKAADSGFNDPAVKVEQKTSERYSIVDAHYKDEPGSLSEIARVIVELGYTIDYASASTRGDVCTSVFYVASEDGKLSTEAAEDLQDRIAEALHVSKV